MTKFKAVETNDKKLLKRFVEKHDLVIHTVGPFQGRTTPCEMLNGEIESGYDYIDICGDMAHAKHSNVHEKEAVRKHDRAVICIGVYPGLSTLVVKKSYEKGRRNRLNI